MTTCGPQPSCAGDCSSRRSGRTGAHRSGTRLHRTGVVAHAAGAPLWYSVDMWSGTENASFEVQVLDDTGNERLLTSVLAASAVLAAGVDAAPPSLRGFHPFGSPDPSGFAAMACDELLVHGRDAALGLGLQFGETRLAPGPSWPGCTRGTRSAWVTIRGRCCCGRTGAGRSRAGRIRNGGAGTVRRCRVGRVRALAAGECRRSLIAADRDVKYLDDRWRPPPVSRDRLDGEGVPMRRQWTDHGRCRTGGPSPLRCSIWRPTATASRSTSSRARPPATCRRAVTELGRGRPLAGRAGGDGALPDAAAGAAARGPRPLQRHRAGQLEQRVGRLREPGRGRQPRGARGRLRLRRRVGPARRRARPGRQPPGAGDLGPRALRLALGRQ